MRFQAFHIRSQQLLPEPFRNPVQCPAGSSFFVRTENQSISFLTHIVGGIAFTKHRQFRISPLIVFRQFGDRPGDDVLMFHRNYRQFETHHAACLTGIVPGTGNHNLTGDVSLGGTDHPFIIRFLSDAGDFGLGINLTPIHPRPLGQSHGEVHRGHMTVIRMVKRTNQITDFCKGPKFLNFFGTNQMIRDSDGACGSRIPSVFIHPFLGSGKTQVPVFMKTNGLSCFFLKFLVEIDAVFVDLAHAVAHVEQRKQTRSMPGRT